MNKPICPCDACQDLLQSDPSTREWLEALWAWENEPPTFCCMTCDEANGGVGPGLESLT